MVKLLLVLGLAAIALSAPSSKVEPRLSKTLSKSASANILVSMNQDTSAVLSKFQNAKFATHGARTNAVAGALQSFAAQSQKEVRSFLDNSKVAYKAFWISNQVYIRGASEELVGKLAQLESVKEITEEFEVKLDPVIQSTNSPPIGILAEWGVENTGAPAVWATGNRGEGVVVGGIDTGVHATHVDLKDNYRGNDNYGWNDVTIFGTATARDDNGHGTHTMGSIVGANGIGVAPGATWIACKALNAAGSGTNAGLIECGQWMACPTTNQADCKSPHLVSNSWGGGQANPFYNTVINAWKAAGIIPIFANGNSGPECQTANSPADSLAGVIAVGASDVTNGLAYFSSKGPTSGGRMKPDISAPGLDVKSAWHTPGTSAYNTISGTSMATPHVAGVVALMLSAKPTLTQTQIETAIFNSANTDVIQTGYNCDSVSESVFPNHAFGHGIINAAGAVAFALKA